jgi:hypothetical protein
MKERTVRLGPREQQIVELLLQGCDNSDIASQLKMARRTVKAHFNRLFLRFGITGGIKRVKLATLLYRRQLCSEKNATEAGYPTSASTVSSNSSLRDSRTAKLRMPSEPLNTSLKTTLESSMTNLDSGTESNLLSGTRPAGQKVRGRPELLESWERSILNLDSAMFRGRNLQH